MGVVRIQGRALPSGDVVDLYADGDRWTDDPVRNAELVGQGWMLPGLVDAHTHPGADPPEQLDDALLRSDLAEHLAAGVTMLRAPGLAGDPPAWFGNDADLPRAVHAGPWIAQHGQFIDGWGRRAEPEDMPGIAAAQAARSGWAKLIGDWRQDDPALSESVLREVVAAVHAVHGRLAVHAQTSAGAAAAAKAGVDSIEHGQGLDPDLLPMLADQGTALTPTLRVIEEALRFRLARGDDRAIPWVATAAVHGDLAAAAVEAGVQVLVGTDSRPHGRVADEIRALAATGMRPHDALAAGSWAARTFLGLPGLIPGAPADAVIYDHDPRDDLGGLDHPSAVVLRGQLVSR
jgi:imidazolonepropionase-like amidohydrolase